MNTKTKKKPSTAICPHKDMCPIFNKHEADLDRSSEWAFLVRWLKAHKEYLKTYPFGDYRYWSIEQGSQLRNYPAIDCATAEYEDFVAKMRHGKVKEQPYENPYKKTKDK